MYAKQVTKFQQKLTGAIVVLHYAIPILFLIVIFVRLSLSHFKKKKVWFFCNKNAPGSFLQQWKNGPTQESKNTWQILQLIFVS